MDPANSLRSGGPLLRGERAAVGVDFDCCDRRNQNIVIERSQ